MNAGCEAFEYESFGDIVVIRTKINGFYGNILYKGYIGRELFCTKQPAFDYV